LPGLTPPPAVVLDIAPVTAPTVAGPLAPTLLAVADGRWDTPATWGGRLPVDGDIVGIPRGRTVELAGATARLNGLWVNGALSFGDADIALTSRFVMVYGRLQAGTEARLYVRRASIVLTGIDTTQDVAGFGTKVIGVGAGGLLKLHGEQRLFWSKLAADANVGATSLTLKDDAGTWRAGDRLVVAASGFDPREAAVVTVTSVSGSTVTFAPALRYRHLGLVQTYDGETLDQRAAVGLLSRNIPIRGADDSDANAFGGHFMVMGGHAQVSGVELTKMGQRGSAGRYPFHWHIVGDRSGNYLMSSAIYDTFQRAVVVHSTHNIGVDGNVAYNIPNHAFVWAEDGDERGTRMTRNLGVLVRNPAPEHFAFRINDAFFGNSSQGEQRSAVFWGRSYNQHVIRDNISAGSLDGFGFFFDLFTPRPFDQDEGGGMVFDGNIAHSTYKTLNTGNQINYPEATTGHGLFLSTGSTGRYEHVFSNFTGFFNVSGAWVEDRSNRLKNAVLADNGTGVMVLRGVIDGVTVIGDSASPVAVPNMPASVTFGFRGAIQVAGSNHGGKRAPHILNTTVIDQVGARIIWDLDNISPASVVSGVRFVNTPVRVVVNTPFKFEFFPDAPTFGLLDATGVFAGDGAPARVMMRDTQLADGACREHLDMQAYTCPLQASLVLQSPISLTLVEESGQVTFLSEFGYFDASMPNDGAVSVVGNGRRYEVQNRAARSRHDFTLMDAQGKTLELSFAANGAASRVMFNGQAVPAATSLGALRAAATSMHFFDAAGGRVHVRVVGGSGTQALSVEAPFVARVAQGRPAVAAPANAVDGFAVTVHPGTAVAALRYAAPGTAAARSLNVAAATLTQASSGAAFGQVARGDTTVVRAHVFARADGIYRLGLWGSGGGTSLYVGDTFVMAEPWAYINSNLISGGQLRSDFGVFNPNGVIALRAGWHTVTAVHAKRPDNNEGSSLLLRWIPPGGGNNWVYPAPKRPS
jgi:hypothetical protein